MIGMEEEYVSLGISMDLELYKEMGWDYTKLEKTYVYFMHQNFEKH
jgi:hypothetical protein